jgi:hypothetical protein
LQQEQQRINRLMRLAQGILTIGILVQQVIHMMMAIMATHTTRDMVTTMAVVIPVTERSKLIKLFLPFFFV